MTFPISDPIFRSNFLTHFAAEACSEKLDQEIGSGNWIIVFGASFAPICRSNFTIQFYDPIFRCRPAGGLAWSTAHGFRPPCDSRPQLAVQKAAVGIGRPPDPMYPIFFGDFFR